MTVFSQKIITLYVSTQIYFMVNIKFKQSQQSSKTIRSNLMLSKHSTFDCFQQIANMQFCFISDYCLKLKTKGLNYQIVGLTKESFQVMLKKILETCLMKGNL